MRSELLTGSAVCVQLNPTYLSAQQAFIDNALATSTATYNIVIVGPPPSCMQA